MKAETKKLTAEERQQMETFMQKVRQKDITVIEAAQTILRNRDSYAQNQVNAYKDGLRKEIDREITFLSNATHQLDVGARLGYEVILSLLDKTQDNEV